MFAKRNSAAISATTEATTTDAPAVPDAAPPVAEQAIAAAAHPVWTDTDETAYVLMLARRKAAKAKRPTGAPRTRLADDVVLVAGTTVTTDKSVLSTIKATVAEAGETGINRADLVAKLKTATFVSAAAKPNDEAWLKGWIAGAVRQAVLVAKPTPARHGLSQTAL